MSDPKVQLGFDDTEPQAGWILVYSIAIILTLIATIVFVTAYYDQTAEKLVYERQQLPINEDMRNLRTREDNDLHSYGYADKAAGLVRVPIEKAVELVLADAVAGKPKYPTTPYQVKKEEPVAAAAPTMPGGNAVAPAAAPHK